MTKYIFHQAKSRGHQDHGWLQTYHTFSFADYYNKERIHFGALRVLNDDTIAGGMGFDMHPHDNMEIITIPLEGEVQHRDSMGNAGIIKKGEVQVMSAGTGIHHSEYNHLNDLPLKLLQIWVFPNQKNVTPRYDQITLKDGDRKNKLQQIVSPNPDDDGVWIHQDAWFNLGKFDQGHTESYAIKKHVNGVYLFVIQGGVTVDDQKLEERDGLGVWETDQLMIRTDKDSEILLMEVPMIF